MSSRRLDSPVRAYFGPIPYTLFDDSNDDVASASTWRGSRRRVGDGMKPSLAASLAFFMAVAACADAQWLKQPTPNIARTAEGKPDLTAPPPRVPDGHPDLSGVWTNRGASSALP